LGSRETGLTNGNDSSSDGLAIRPFEFVAAADTSHSASRQLLPQMVSIVESMLLLGLSNQAEEFWGICSARLECRFRNQERTHFLRSLGQDFAHLSIALWQENPMLRRDWLAIGLVGGAAAYWQAVAEDATTELGKLAGSMKAGEWAELKTTGYGPELLNVQSHHILEYTDTAVWDPKSRQLLFVGQGHYSALRFIAYSADQNAWKTMPTPTWWKGDAETGKGPIGHAYNNNALDPEKGLLFHHQSATRLVHRYDIEKGEWSTLPEIKDAATGHGTALAYFPQRKGLVRILAGDVHFFDEEKNAWSLIKQQLPVGPYHNLAKYNPVDQSVILGAGNGSKDLYHFDREGEFTRLPEAPHLLRISSTVVSVDPVSGDLLVLNMEDKHKFHAFDLRKNEWKPLPDAPISEGVAAPIGTHGVTLNFSYRPMKVFLYKHAS
jgi:hypothetical protein